jgi:hypothetical protein
VGALKSFMPRLAGLGSLMAAGRVAVILFLCLVVLLALTGTFGVKEYRDSAQAVLRILFGRKDKPG